MKNRTQQLLRDLKAAAVLGNPEAVDIAMDGLLAFPGVAANDRMSDGFIEKTILPVGKALAPLETSQLRPLITHNLAAGRATGAVALADQFMVGKYANRKDLGKLANDPRVDVRLSFGRGLILVGNRNPQKLFDLGSSWLTNSKPKPRYTALIFLPSLAESHGEHIIDSFSSLNDDTNREVHAALVDALNILARAGHAESVLNMLTLWTSEKRPNGWVISRVLSASWVCEYPSETETILRNLSLKTGTASQVRSAIEALDRHGLKINL